MWSALAVIVANFLFGLMVGSAITWKRARRDARQIVSESLDAELPKDPTTLAALVSRRLGTRFAAVLAGDKADQILVAVAVNKDMAQEDELFLLAAAVLNLHESVMRQLAEIQAKQQAHH